MPMSKADALFCNTLDEMLECDAEAGDIVSAIKEYLSRRRSSSEDEIASPDSFSEFWAAYPKRQGANPRKPAAKLFAAALKRGVDPATIIAAIKAGTGYDTTKVGTEYVPQAQKWLRDERWQDFQPPVPGSEKNPPAGVSGVFVPAGTDAWDAWVAYNRAHGKGSPPIGRSGGWVMPSRWPPNGSAGSPG